MGKNFKELSEIEQVIETNFKVNLESGLFNPTDIEYTPPPPEKIDSEQMLKDMLRIKKEIDEIDQKCPYFNHESKWCFECSQDHPCGFFSNVRFSGGVPWLF